MNDEEIERLVNEQVEIAKKEEREKILKIINNLENPAPKNVFKWNNPEELNFNRGRFNQHCFDIWESFRDNLKQKLVER